MEKIVVIGAVAAGTSAAAKARRNNEQAVISIYEKDSFISYSGCGMPYYLGGIIKNTEELTPRNEGYFKSKYNIDVLTSHEVLAVFPDKKEIEVKSLATGRVFTDLYDKLIIATGAKAFVPPIKGAECGNVFTLRNISDMNRIKAFIDTKKPQTCAIIGTGFIGIELCENFKKTGIEVTMLEKQPHVMPNLDSDMAVYIKEHLEKNGVNVLCGANIAEIIDDSVLLSDGTKIPADFVIISAGVRPETSLAKAAGIELGATGAIKVNSSMQTNFKDIYACGDCIEHFHIVSKAPVYRPLGSTANRTGRIAGDCATGGSLQFKGILGTGIFKIFDMTVGQTGLSEAEARELGYNSTVCHNIKPDKPEYMGGKEMVIKAVADSKSGRLLGVQIVGFEGVDKRLDVLVTAITFNAKAEDLFHLDLAYAPPFSTTKDPVMYTGMILDNAIKKGRPLIGADSLQELINSKENYILIDAREEKQYQHHHIDSAKNIPQSMLREKADALDKDAVVVTYCNKGVTGNAAQNIMIGKGFKKVYNLSGGHKHYIKIKGNDK